MKRWILLFALALVLGFAGWAAREAVRPYRAYSGKLGLTVRAGTRAPEIAKLLTEHGVLAHRLPFLLRAWLGRRHETLKAGEYLFDRPLSPVEVYRKLARGQVYLHSVVIPEGSDRFEMARILNAQLGLSPQAFLAATSSGTPVRDLDPAAPSLEGYLFPDTYRFPRGVTAQVVIEKMLERFRSVYSTKIRSSLSGEALKLHDVITLASMVERETPAPAERPEIAGIFVRRLNRHMLLECDPTVVYALRLAQGSSDAPEPAIMKIDLAAASPYNTYLYPGLPPGPICSPGLASIRAALSPQAGNTLYFVSNHHGGHLFARTLQEHERNVARSRRELAALRQNNGLAGTAEPDRATDVPGTDFAEDHGQSPGKQKTTHSKLRRAGRHKKRRPRRATGDS